MREEVVQQAQKFLSNPIVVAKPEREKEQFLEKKGLSKEEIAEAMRRAASTSVSSAVSPEHVTSTPAYTNRPSVPSKSTIPQDPRSAYAPPVSLSGNLAATFLRKRLADLDYERAAICHALVEAELCATQKAPATAQPQIGERSQRVSSTAPPTWTDAAPGIVKSGGARTTKPWERTRDAGPALCNVDTSDALAEQWGHRTDDEAVESWGAKDDSIKPWESSAVGRLTAPWGAEERRASEDEPEKTPDELSKV